MRLAFERRRPTVAHGTELLEVVTPRTNGAIVAPTENFLAAVSLPEPFSLELAAAPEARWFLLRAGMQRAYTDESVPVAFR